MSDIALTSTTHTDTRERIADSARDVASPTPPVRIDRVAKSFDIGGKSVPVLESIDLEIEPGSFFCIVGGSGCGKSTLLRMIAGLEQATTGRILLGERRVDRPGLDRGMVFQEPRLMPWLTVQQNIEFGIAEKRRDRRARMVAREIDLVGLRGFEQAYPHQLSGGMAQRVGLARALVNRPSVLLLDEPLGALDALTRQHMQQELLRIWKHERSTMILVTHDIDEALFLADRIAVLGGKPGTLRRLVEVNLPRPRDRSDPVFTALRQTIWDTIFSR